MPLISRIASVVPALLVVAAHAAPLEEIIIVGRRDAFAPVMTSATTDVLHFDEQVSLNRTVGDWVERLPGVSLNGQGGLLQSYSLRGFSRWRVRTELNGVPIITDRRAGNSASFVPPDLLAQVSVDKSAASTLYGSGAMGGVVGLSTRHTEGPVVLADARSNDDQLSLTAVTGDAGRVAAGISMRRAQAAQGPDGQPLNSGFEQIAGFFSGRSAIRNLNVRYSWIPSLGRDIGKSNALFPDERISSYPREMHSVSQVELRSEGQWFLRAYHHYQDLEADVERLDQRRNLTRYRAHTVGGLFQASTARFGGDGSVGLEWLGRRGVAIDDEEFASDGASPQVLRVVDGDEDTLGAFFDQRWLFDAVQISAGLRYDSIAQSAMQREDSDGQWSGSAGLEYAVNEAWSMRSELATGYRFPGLSERYFSGSTPRGEVLGNPDLQPETRRNIELGLEYNPGASPLQSSVSAYYSDLRDYIERYAVNPQLISYRNLQSASIRGVELDLSYRAGLFTHRLSYQWQEGEDANGNTLADLNPPGWRYFLTWEGRRSVFSSDLGYRAARDDFGPDELPLDAAWTWNARLSQRVSDDWRAEVYFNNILDETYRATADEIAPLQPGRTVGIRFEWRKG